VKALTTYANFLKAKLRPNQHKKDTTKAKTRKDKVAKKPNPKRKPPQTHVFQEKCYA